MCSDPITVEAVGWTGNSALGGVDDRNKSTRWQMPRSVANFEPGDFVACKIRER